MVHIGVEMNSAAASGGPQPKLCIVEDSDKPDLKKLKATILKMAAYDPNERCKAPEVAEILGQLTGTNRYKRIMCVMIYQRRIMHMLMRNVMALGKACRRLSLMH